jgi:hypothetical protein
MQLNVKERLKGVTVFLFDQLTLTEQQIIGPLQIWGVSTGPNNQTSLKSPGHTVYGVARELDGEPHVNRISIGNNSPSPLFMPEGWFLNSEHLLQSRVLVNDVFIEPFENQFVSVTCIESRRWSPSATSISQEGRVPPSVIATMRSVDVSRGDVESIRFRQDKTWNRISTLSTKGATSPTNSLIEIMQGLTNKSSQRYASPRLQFDQSGVLIALDGYPLLLEVFDSQATLAQHIGPLIEATLLDSSEVSEKLASDSQIERFLKEVLNSPLKSSGKKQSSEHLSVSTRDLTSRMSRVEGIPLHALSINMKHPAFN